jgi:hypothetical protein
VFRFSRWAYLSITYIATIMMIMNSLMNVLFLALVVIAQPRSASGLSLPTGNVVVGIQQQQLPSAVSNVQEKFGSSSELVSVLDGLKSPIQSYVDIW